MDATFGLFANYKIKRMVLFMAYENKIKFYEEQVEALLYNIEEKEKDIAGAGIIFTGTGGGGFFIWQTVVDGG